MRLARLAVCIALAGGLCAQQDRESGLALLRRVHRRMEKAMAGIPNYTCTEKITRVTLSPAGPRVDRIRLDVAMVDGTELYAWPGAPFERTDPSLLVAGGPIGTGDYSTFLNTVFFAEDVTYDVGRNEVLAGRQVIRYDYNVAGPHYRIRTGSRHAIVGYRGSIWVDPATAELLALEVIADDIPQALDVSGVRTLIYYGLVTFAGEQFSFPSTAEFTAEYRRGKREVRSRMEFTGCRQYTSESTISFGEPAAPGSQQVTPRSQLLPPGLVLELALDTALDLETCYAGDPVSATLVRAIEAGALRIAKGARVLGRVLSVETASSATAVIEFSKIETAGTQLRFVGRLDSFDPIPRVNSGRPAANLRDKPGWRSAAKFVIGGGLTRIPAGFTMKWKTVSE